MRSSIRAPRRGMPRDPRPPPVITTDAQAITDKPDNLRIRNENLAILSILSGHFHIPDEISLKIIDYSERWLACSFRSMKASPTLHIRSRHGEETSSEILSSPVTKQSTFKDLRQVSFNIRSRNQGHVGDPTRGNWSWFEVVLKNHIEPPEVKSHFLISNPMLPANHEDHASMTDQVVKLTRMERILEIGQWFWDNLSADDCIYVVGHVKYRGWENIIESARLTLWKMDDLMSDLPVEEELTEH